MKISDAGILLIKQHEGVRHEAYQDSVGIWTIGVGHTGQEVHKGLYLTDAQIDATLREDLAAAERCVEVNCGGDFADVLTQNQYDALVSLVFNIGCGAFKGSTLLKLLLAGNIIGASEQFVRWDRAGGKEIGGLLARREAERDLFLA